jgi:hypothetical protein
MHCPWYDAWLARFLHGHADTVMRITVTPREDPMLQAARVWLDRYMALIAKVVPLVCCELIYNIDEAGLSDWEDGSPKKVLASAESFGEKLHYGLDRGVRYQSLFCTISAGWNASCPFLVGSDRRNRDLFRTRIREKTNLWIWVKDPLHWSRWIRSLHQAKSHSLY